MMLTGLSGKAMNLRTAVISADFTDNYNDINGTFTYKLTSLQAGWL